LVNVHFYYRTFFCCF